MIRPHNCLVVFICFVSTAVLSPVFLRGGEPPRSVRQGPLTALKEGDFLDRSRFIFVGRLLQKRSFREGRFILTSYRFQVERNVKNEAPRQVEMVEYGGVFEGYAMQVSHQPNYRPGGEYLIFSYLDLKNRLRTLAGALGAFPVTSTAAGEKIVRLQPGHPLQPALNMDGPIMFYPLDEITSRVHQAVEQRKQ